MDSLAAQLSAMPRNELHLPFADIIASAPEGSAAWYGAMAGFLILRLIDQWGKAQRKWCKSPSSRELRIIYAAIAGMSPGPVKETLKHLLTALSGTHRIQPSMVMTWAFVYGHLTQHTEQQWHLAVNIFETVLAHAPTGLLNPDLVPECHIRRGFCLRTMGYLDESMIAFTTAQRLAKRRGDLRTELLGGTGKAALLKETGDISTAECMLEDIRHKAESICAIKPSAAMDHIIAHTKHELGTLANRYGYSERAMHLYRDALRYYPHERQREYVRIDIANNLTAMGEHGAAREIYTPIYNETRSRLAHQCAAINLMEIATIERQELAFEHYRTELSQIALPPRLSAHYQLYLGEGLVSFGHAREAQMAFREAVETASNFKVVEVLGRAQAAAALS